MAEDFAAVAVAPSLIETADMHRDVPMRVGSVTMADRAERGVQLVSRWAGIVAFVGAIAAIGWLII
ncbi:hypothetical protein [Sphingobium sp.]|uniref:hypothetical protein n=1 Tax=Sphingobium sp. TaxID=1912891 RepID=UPI0028BF0037|nr:hypothetical protein [Sphingobium sp.]